MPKNFQNFRYRGVTFVFKVDPADSTMLHIYARHLKQPSDAIQIWFGGVHSYNLDHKRFEAVLNGVRIYWFPIDVATDIIMIASCHSL